MNEEIDDDCARMDRLQSKPPGWIDRGLIEMLVEPIPDEIDGIPANPERFSLLHPEFPVDMGIKYYPVSGKSNGYEMFPMLNERSTASASNGRRGK